MKQKLLLIVITLAMLTTTAQETPKHKWDIGAEISSPEEFTDPTVSLAAYAGVSYNEKNNYAFSMGLFGTCYLHNNVFIRFRANTSNRKKSIHSDTSRDPSSVPFSRDATLQQSSGTFILGIGKNIVEQKFIRASIGFELSATYFGKFTDDYYSYEMAGWGGNNQFIYRTYIAPGGYSIRFGPFVGGQFIFLKNFSVGPEISYAVQYYKTGGEATDHQVGVDINNSSNNYDYIINLSTTKEGMDFSKIKAIIRMAYSF